MNLQDQLSSTFKILSFFLHFICNMTNYGSNTEIMIFKQNFINLMRKFAFYPPPPLCKNSISIPPTHQKYDMTQSSDTTS